MSSPSPDWQVTWPDGPAADGLIAPVDRPLSAASILKRDSPAYLRAVALLSDAPATARTMRLGLPPLGSTSAHVFAWDLEKAPDPGGGATGDRKLAAQTWRLAASQNERHLLEAFSQYGLAGLRAGRAPLDNVLPFCQPTRR